MRAKKRIATPESPGLDRVLKDEAMPSRTEVLGDRSPQFCFSIKLAGLYFSLLKNTWLALDKVGGFLGLRSSRNNQPRITFELCNPGFEISG